MKLNITNKNLYWGLIITFAILYLCVSFVSTLHAVTFFSLGNSLILSILLSLCFELGQSSVLFSLLMTKNKDKLLPWLLMFLLTGLQITGNVFASFKHLVTSGSNDWIYWQKTILFGVQAPNAEMYQVIIAYIQGALLPIVSLGLISLVASNIKLVTEENEQSGPEKSDVKELQDKETVSSENLYSQKASTDALPNFQFTPEPPELKDYIDEEAERLIPESKINAEIIDEKITDLSNLSEKSKEQFQNEFSTVIKETDKLNKKRGRPPKTEKKAAVSKKALEPLQKEEVKVPIEKKHRVSNPLTKKGNKPELIKHIEQINAPSKGEELIESLKDEIKLVEDSSPIEQPKVIETSLDEPVKEYKEGIEVVDVKAVPIKKTKLDVDKFGIPVQKNERKNFDKI